MSPLPRFLIVEDERPLALALAATVRQAGAAPELAPTAAQARRLLRQGPRFAAMILDIGLPDENGLAFLETVDPAVRPPVLVITAHGEIDNTIAARKLGVREFFSKPLNFEAFNETLEKLIGNCRPGASGAPITPRIAPPESPGDHAFIGAAPTMRIVFQQIAQACASREPVLIRGETGVGKTHAAQLISKHSQSATAPFAIHFAGGENEGPDLDAALGQAAGGTLLLEDIGSLSPADQRTLVRRIEEDGPSLPRLLATCEKNLLDQVHTGGFRSDLYYRLQVLEVRLPALRDRQEDLPVLVAFFSGQLAPDRRVGTDRETLGRLAEHPWPGNLRELRNVLSYAITATAGGPRIEPGHLPSYLGEPAGRSSSDSADDSLPPFLHQALGQWLDDRLATDPGPTYRDLADSLEIGLLQDLLPRFDGKLARLANELQANRGTLRKKLKGE